MNSLEYRPNIQFKPDYQRLDTIIPPDFGTSSLTPRDWADKLQESAGHIIHIREHLRSTLSHVQMPVTPEIQALMDAEGVSDLSFESYLKLADEYVTHESTDLSDFIDIVRSNPDREDELRSVYNFNSNKKQIIDYCHSAGLEPGADDGLVQWAGMAATVAFSRELQGMTNIVGYMNCTRNKLEGQAKGILNSLQGCVDAMLRGTKATDEKLTVDWGLKIDPEDCTLDFFTLFSDGDTRIFEIMVGNGAQMIKTNFQDLQGNWDSFYKKIKGSGAAGANMMKTLRTMTAGEANKKFQEAIQQAKDALKQVGGWDDKTGVPGSDYNPLSRVKSEASKAWDKASDAYKTQTGAATLAQASQICKAGLSLLKSATDACSAAQSRAIDLTTLMYRMNFADEFFTQTLLKLMEDQRTLNKFADVLQKVRNIPKINRKPKFYLGNTLLNSKTLFPYRPSSFDPNNMFKLPPCIEQTYVP